MDIGTVIVLVENGAIVGAHCAHPDIARLAIWTGDVDSRVIAIDQPTTEDEIANAVSRVRWCLRTGAWNCLDSAGGVVREALDVASIACSSLADDLADYDRPRDVAGDLDALLTDAVRTHAQRLEARRLLTRALEALDGFDDAHASAAAVGGDHHALPLCIEGGDHVRH